MKERVPLQIVDGRLILTALLYSGNLDINQKIVRFVIDTGSIESYIGERDALDLQILVKTRSNLGNVALGGTIYNKFSMPIINLLVFKENNRTNNFVPLKVLISALKSDKKAVKEIKIAEAIPSILGMDFLRQQRLSLHVILTEEMAYLEVEG